MSYVAGIGAANVDIYGKSDIPLRIHYDHPAHITTSVGGVTRNILESISKLGISTSLLTAVGNDVYGNQIISHCVAAGMDTSHVRFSDKHGTGIFMQVQNNDNDMQLALCDMSVLEEIDLEYVDQVSSIIQGATALVLDPSLNETVLIKIMEEYGPRVPVFIDPVSDHYADKIAPILKNVFCIKPNLTEFQQLSGITVTSDSDLVRGGEIILNRGVTNIVVSLGKEGCFYMDSDGNVIKRKLRPVSKVINASGAGDSFFAALVGCHVLGKDIDLSLDYALASGISAILSEGTTNNSLSFQLLDEILNQYRR